MVNTSKANTIIEQDRRLEICSQAEFIGNAECSAQHGAFALQQRNVSEQRSDKICYLSFEVEFSQLKGAFIEERMI
jgi:hypothetical protein